MREAERASELLVEKYAGLGEGVVAAARAFVASSPGVHAFPCLCFGCSAVAASEELRDAHMEHQHQRWLQNVVAPLVGPSRLLSEELAAAEQLPLQQKVAELQRVLEGKHTLIQQQQQQLQQKERQQEQLIQQQRQQLQKQQQQLQQPQQQLETLPVTKELAEQLIARQQAEEQRWRQACIAFADLQLQSGAQQQEVVRLQQQLALLEPVLVRLRLENESLHQVEERRSLEQRQQQQRQWDQQQMLAASRKSPQKRLPDHPLEEDDDERPRKSPRKATFAPRPSTPAETSPAVDASDPFLPSPPDPPGFQHGTA